MAREVQWRGCLLVVSGLFLNYCCVGMLLQPHVKDNFSNGDVESSLKDDAVDDKLDRGLSEQPVDEKGAFLIKSIQEEDSNATDSKSNDDNENDFNDDDDDADKKDTDEKVEKNIDGNMVKEESNCGEVELMIKKPPGTDTPTTTTTTTSSSTTPTISAKPLYKEIRFLMFLPHTILHFGAMVAVVVYQPSLALKRGLDSDSVS